jgi:pimeloyl-ACP methyl ester carboxylesterase
MRFPMTYLALALALVLVITGLAVFTTIKAREIEKHHPPAGTFIAIGDMRMHAVHVPAGPQADLPPIVFLHGASGNLRDQMLAFRGALEGRAELLFVDRPGHGYSERGGKANDFPDGQARSIALLMDELGIKDAIIVAHSFGSAIAASFALDHPERTRGLVFLAPATHPWPGGVAWYYGVARAPLIGPIFTRLVSLPVGLGRVASGSRCVFAPNPMPADYAEITGPALVLRPRAFRANAIDVANLHDYVSRTAPRYNEIQAPTVIITGDSDDIVFADIHSRGLARDITGAELLWIANLGHKPDYVARDLAIAAIENVAGGSNDLQAMARALEERIAGDDETC